MWEQIVDFYLRVKSGKLYLKEKIDMSEKEKRELTDRIKAMSLEEWEIVAAAIPAHICLNRIQQELDCAEEFKKSIKAAMNLSNLKTHNQID